MIPYPAPPGPAPHAGPGGLSRGRRAVREQASAAARGPAGMGRERPPLLVIAHGSRDPRHARTVREVTALVAAARPGLRVETAFLDFCAPSVPQAVERLAADGVREAVALPLLLTRAFHAKSDIPAVLRGAAAVLPRLRLHMADVLGPSPLLTAALERRLREAGLRPGERASTGVVLASAGSTDPEAAAVIAAVARAWQRTGWYAVRPAFASAALPRTGDAVRALRAEGAARVAVAPYVIAPGFLPDRIVRGAEEAGADVLAPVLGAAPELCGLLLRRYDEALAQSARPAIA
ncbi:Sirohydrochlorin ferrochelatase [Actinacidiphila guanduensis]|uniref:Sirohydrochlorin ferrochelatase n=2 Tax=Actinacidiphila guanduensis TaxID=310781 RepID=A0A1H0KDB0_9ACTN|nr:Sirohydrochlorin ferrochelatase [Actinacidiphila guanduensis]